MASSLTGLSLFSHQHPALKRWAIIRHPFRVVRPSGAPQILSSHTCNWPLGLQCSASRRIFHVVSSFPSCFSCQLVFCRRRNGSPFNSRLSCIVSVIHPVSNLCLY